MQKIPINQVGGFFGLFACFLTNTLSVNVWSTHPGWPDPPFLPSAYITLGSQCVHRFTKEVNALYINRQVLLKSAQYLILCVSVIMAPSNVSYAIYAYYTSIFLIVSLLWMSLNVICGFFPYIGITELSEALQNEKLNKFTQSARICFCKTC